MHNHVRAAWLLAMVTFAAAPGCGDGTGTTGTTGGSTGQGGDDTTSSTTTGGDGGSGGTGSTGSTGGGGAGTGGTMMPETPGHQGTAVVSAGAVITNQKYRMVFSAGEPIQSGAKTAGTKYRLQGGLVGATENLP